MGQTSNLNQRPYTLNRDISIVIEMVRLLGTLGVSLFLNPRMALPSRRRLQVDNAHRDTQAWDIEARRSGKSARPTHIPRLASLTSGQGENDDQGHDTQGCSIDRSSSSLRILPSSFLTCTSPTICRPLSPSMCDHRPYLSVLSSSCFYAPPNASL